MNGTKPRRRWGRVLILLLLLAGAAALVWRFTRPDPVPVIVGVIDRGRVESSVANTRAGTVNACRRARLSPPAGGQITRLPVKKGDRVRAGQVLLELWNRDATAQARVAREQAEAARLRAQEACSMAEVAERDAERARELRSAGLIPEEQFDRAQSQAQTRRAGCSAARADMQQADARIAAAEAELARLVLRAPFAGVVADLRGELGEFTTPSPPGIPTPPAVDLIDDSCLYVTAPIDEVDAPNVRVGMPAHITIDAFSGRRFPGRVRRVAPYVLDVERQARTVDVEVEFDEVKDVEALLVGYSADVEIILNVREDVLRVPTQALLEGGRVLVVSADGTLEERKLQTGLSNWEYTEVVSGAEQDQEVVLSLEREGVRPGAPARVEARRNSAAGAAAGDGTRR